MRRRAASSLLLCAVTLLGCLAGPSVAGAKRVTFAGRTVTAPDSWPVIRLARHPRTCVRLDRRAVFLGRPRTGQSCPAGAIGRRRAILLQPPPAAGASRAPRPVRLSGGDFTGLGFDACTAPSRREMSAWDASPYRAVGVYIGGLNRACSQPSLTASWVAEQVSRGWHLIPTYVGLQAPTSSCGSCAKLSSGAAYSQGTAAANDAVAQAKLVAIAPGSPIYFDMESYSRTGPATSATLAFLSAWTARLHALGYDSGVYSSSSSGIADLASRPASAYNLPDDLWIANWNGSRSTADPNVPASAWNDHQRIHQYAGGHDERYGGVTINIDSDYVEGATAGVGAGPPGEDDPRGRVELVRSPGPGRLRVAGWAFDPSSPQAPLAIRAVVGGAGEAQSIELGQVAGLTRPDVGQSHRAAGSDHGFDAVFPTLRSGRQKVCVYALDVGPGADKLLGCKGAGVGVAVTVKRRRVSRGAVRLRLRCEWPAGTECPGRILLRARLRLRRPGRGRHPPRTRTVRVGLGQRRFHLTGERSHAFVLRLNRRGRKLAAAPGRLPAQLLVAIPGGRRYVKIRLR